MTTKEEWHAKFVASFGREPTLQEFQTAIRNSEFQNGPAAAHPNGVPATSQPPAQQQPTPAGQPTDATPVRPATPRMSQPQQPKQPQAQPQPKQRQQTQPAQRQQPQAKPKQPLQPTQYQQTQPRPYVTPQPEAQPTPQYQYPTGQPTSASGTQRSASQDHYTVRAAINKLAGGEGEVDLHLKDTFSEVFKKHSRKEADRIFIGGTSLTTPKEKDIAATWPKPWLFSRVLVFFIASYALLYFIQQVGTIQPSYVGLIFIGALAVPFSTVIFYFECNAPRNISFWSVLQMFFIGGILSLVITMFLNFFVTSNSGLLLPLSIGIVEELAKLAALAIFVYILNPKYILNGLLIGGAIGAGFAVFETAGYGFNALMEALGTALQSTDQLNIINNIQSNDRLGVILQEYGFSSMNSSLILRGCTSIGGHVAWAAISGAALVMATKGDKLEMSHFIDKRFLSLFWIPIVLHAAWDLGIAYPDSYFFNSLIYLIILIALAWTTLLVLINSGLEQIQRLQGVPKTTAQPQRQPAPQQA